jgi:hypothetical protein
MSIVVRFSPSGLTTSRLPAVLGRRGSVLGWICQGCPLPRPLGVTACFWWVPKRTPSARQALASR